MAEQKYRVIERLEAGGMAEVFRGEAASVQGFRKEVAIKRVLPHLAQNEAFIAMFLDEARLGARLNHANIVTVFDIGSADNTFFIVMEFVDGANLKSVVEGVKKRGQRVALKHVLYIGIEACRGLSYAHEAVDEHEQPLQIVHRDISPPNILMSKRGEIKLTDFGLAKATTQLEDTDPGVVKGKFSYLAPETASGDTVDARADIFALGIVLWEMIAGKRLFIGENDYQTVKLVQQANIPSLQMLNHDVDDELDEIIGRALTRDPGDRFQSAREFGDALAGYLFSHQLKVTSYDIANLVKTVADGKGKARKPRQEQSIIDRLIQDELMSFTSLDDMEGSSIIPGAKPLDPADVKAGSDSLRPRRASMENPAAWFTDEPGLRDSRPDDTAPQRPVKASTPTAAQESSDMLELEDLSGLQEIDDDIALPPVQRDRSDPTTKDEPATREVHVPRKTPTPAVIPPALIEEARSRHSAEQGEGNLAALLEGTGEHQIPPQSSVQSLEKHLPERVRRTNTMVTVFVVVLLLAGAAAGAWFATQL